MKNTIYCECCIKTNNGISDLFIKDEERTKVCGDVKLIPQLFWGNFRKPQLVILGKNPSYSIEDEIDNKYYAEELKNNLMIENHYDIGNTNTINLLSDFNNSFCSSHASKWWRNYFSCLNETNNSSFMKDVAIINIYGYYSKLESPYSAFNKKDILNKAHIKVYLDMVRKILSEAKTIVIMWKGSIKGWKYLLNEGNNEFFNKIKDKIYVANAKNRKVRVLKIEEELKLVNLPDFK